MIAKIYTTSSVAELKRGVGGYFYGKITSSGVEYKGERKIKPKWNDGIKTDRYTSVEKKYYNVTPISATPTKIDRYLEIDCINLNSSLLPEHCHTRILDKKEHINDRMLDEIY
jgi:hypothetical protein